MKTLKMRRVAWIIAFALIMALSLALCVGAENGCEHAEGYDNGFCIGCGACQEAPLNEGVYEISNAGQLYYVAQLMREKDSTLLQAKLMCNVTVNADLLDTSGEPRTGAKLWVPIGNSTTPAQNIRLDGQGYYISGLYAKYEDGRDVGLFGNTTNGVMVQNLGIIDSYFYSSSGFVGGIVGNAADYTQMQFCYVDATLESPVSHAGGIAGALDSEGLVPSGARFCYTTYSKFIHGAQGDTAIANCYYLSDSAADDGIAGTEYFKANWKLADDSELLDALSAAEKEWVISCYTGCPALLADHVYEYPCVPECKVCDATGRTDQVPHTYDNDCDRECNVCRRINPSPVVHEAYTSCGTVCRHCGVTIAAKTAHQYSNECDATCDCGFERDEALQHMFDSNCDATCNLCSHVRSKVPHVFDNDCDRVCNACGVTRPPVHTYDNSCDGDCNVCGEKRTVAHVFGEYVVTQEPTSLRNGEKEHTCTLCGLKETEVIARTGVALWVIVLGGIGAGLVLTVGGFSLYWFVIKKRSFAQFFGKEPAEKAKKKK